MSRDPIVSNATHGLGAFSSLGDPILRRYMSLVISFLFFLSFFSFRLFQLCFSFSQLTRKTRMCVHMQSDEVATNTLWTPQHIGRFSQTVYGFSHYTLSLCVWVVVFLLLCFLFAAQFSWFPWPLDKPVGDPSRFLLGGKPPTAFFKECVPSSEPLCTRLSLCCVCVSPFHKASANKCNVNFTSYRG
jgi:hypothetical protein